MRRKLVKKPRQIVVKAAVKSTPSKPTKTGLKKSDPDYFRKIGLISAKKRKVSGIITSEQLSAWARKSHLHRKKKA
jgi:hypothetical protein